MSGMTEQDVMHALEILGLTLPTTQEDLERAKRVQLYNWEPARYANLTNNPKQYMKNYKIAEDMTKKIEAAYALLCAVLVPDENEGSGQG
jgi:preprotein translocase subunit Sec63